MALTFSMRGARPKIFKIGGSPRTTILKDVQSRIPDFASEGQHINMPNVSLGTRYFSY